MSEMSSQITNLTIVYSTVYSGADQRRHQSYGDRWIPSTKGQQVTRKMFPFNSAMYHIVIDGYLDSGLTP